MDRYRSPPCSAAFTESIGSWETHIPKIVRNEDGSVAALVFAECDVHVLDDVLSVEVTAPVGHQLKLNHTHTCHFSLVSNAPQSADTGHRGSAPLCPAKSCFSGKISLLFEFQMHPHVVSRAVGEETGESFIIDVPIERIVQLRVGVDRCMLQAMSSGPTSALHFAFRRATDVSQHQDAASAGSSFSPGPNNDVIEMMKWPHDDSGSFRLDAIPLENVMIVRCATDCTHEVALATLRNTRGFVVDAIKALTHQSEKPCCGTVHMSL